MNTCDTCKHWECYDNSTIQHRCLSAKVCGTNKSPKWNNENILVVEITAHWQGLFTGPKFGCIHHEPK